MASGGMGGMQPGEGRSRASNGLQGQAATHPHLAHTPRIAPIFNWTHLLVILFFFFGNMDCPHELDKNITHSHTPIHFCNKRLMFAK
jgi:hypothetical protein